MELPMKRLTLLTAAAALAAGAAFAASHQPFGAHFLEQWDLDEDGAVSLTEATEKRGDIFTMFDVNEDDVLDAEEYAAFDTHREEDAQMHREDGGMGDGQGMGQGHGHGQGMGHGNGHGQGMGMGKGNPEPGFMRVHSAMAKEFNDTNGDGTVTRAEFEGATPRWFERMDRSGDNAITSDDFGPNRG